MDNKELQKKVWTNIEKSQKKAAKFEDTVAVSFSLISEENEDLYVAVVNGKLAVEPYHYNENGCEIEATAETINKLFAGDISFDKALKDGVVVVKSGDVAKFKALECLVPSKKAAAKKPAAKKATATKKTAAKPAEKKAPAAKTAEKKATPAAKTAAPAAKPAAAAAKPAATSAKPAAPAASKPAAPAAKPAEKKAADTKPAAKK